MTQVKAGKPRYEVRFTNGTWIIFDNHFFKACEAFRTRKAAFAALNA